MVEARNMMLAAWNEGAVCCPNAISNPESPTELLGLEADVQVQIVPSFGHPGRPQDPQARPPQEVARRP